MKISFQRIIIEAYNRLIVFLKKPVWALITGVCIGITGWVTFEFVNNIGVAGIDFMNIYQSGFFMFLFRIIFQVVPYESFFGFFNEGPFLLPFVFSGIIFIIYRIVDSSFFGKVPELSESEKTKRPGDMFSFIVFEFMVTAVFVVVMIIAMVVLSFVANVSLGWSLVHSAILLLFLSPVTQLFVLLFRQLTKLRVIVFLSAFLMVGIFIVFESASYFANQQGVIAVFSGIHTVLQWISPIHYGVAGIVGNTFAGYLVNFLFLLVLGAAIGAGGYLVSHLKGAKK